MVTKSNFYKLRVKEIAQETEDCISISFDLPEDNKEDFSYLSGQYLTFKAQIENEEVRRSYSLCSEPSSGTFKVGIKRIEKGLFSKDWVYENVFGLSPDQYEGEKDQQIVEALHKFRMSQLENEGNDPAESGISYGTPHDLASLYGNKRDKSVGPAQVPTGYDEKEPGRPVEKPQNYGSDKGNFSRDPLGKGGQSSPKVEKPSDGNKISTFEVKSLKQSLQKLRNKKQIIKETNENGMLSEENIKSQK